MKSLERLAIAFAFFALMVSITALASDNLSDIWSYDIQFDEVTLTKYKASSSDAVVDIPEEIDGYPVTKIEKAFKGNKDLEYVIIPSTVTEINGTFEECGNLSTVEFEGDGLLTIGRDSFSQCKNLHEIDIPNSVERIESGAFYGTFIKEFSIPTELKYIGTFINHDQTKEEIESEYHTEIITNSSSISIPYNVFSNQRDRLFGYYWYFDEEGNYLVTKDMGIPAGETVYRLKQLPLLDQYIQKCENIYEEISKNGIMMSEGNDYENIKALMESMCPAINDENIEISVNLVSLPGDMDEVFPAVGGTYSNPKGKNGLFGLSIVVKDTFTGEQEEIRYMCFIHPTIYSGSGANNISSGGSSYYSGDTGRSAVSVQTDNGIITTNPYIYEGTLEAVDGNLRLRKPDGQYASSQWAFINNHWYLFGNDTNALKGWRKVNGYWYYMNADGVMLTGLQNINDEWYYMNEYGTMLTGWNLINNIWYYFDESGKMLKDTRTPDGYYVNSKGEWVA